MSDPVADPVPNDTVRIASINVFFVNRGHARVLSFIRTAQPDAVALLEVTSEWRAALSVLNSEYPYRPAWVSCGETGNAQSVRTRNCVDGEHPTPSGQFQMGKSVDLAIFGKK